MPMTDYDFSMWNSRLSTGKRTAMGNLRLSKRTYVLVKLGDKHGKYRFIK